MNGRSISGAEMSENEIPRWWTLRAERAVFFGKSSVWNRCDFVFGPRYRGLGPLNRVPTNAVRVGLALAISGAGEEGIGGGGRLIALGSGREGAPKSSDVVQLGRDHKELVSSSLGHLGQGLDI